jgi:hypothetical protein
MFLAWDKSVNPQMTVRLRNISFMPAQTNHMALFAKQDALHWDKYSYQADIAIDSPNGQAGISFYQQDENNYYLLVLDKDKRTVRLVVVQNNSAWVLAEKPFDPGGGTNEVDVNLTVAATLAVTINQQKLFLLHDESFSAGTVGLWVAPGTRAYFGNINVRYGGQ